MARSGAREASRPRFAAAPVTAAAVMTAVAAVLLVIVSSSGGPSPAGAATGAGDLCATRSDSVGFRSDGVELRGMLRFPPGYEPGSEPLPAVVLLPGGGRQYLTLEPDYWAGRLAAAGIASLVYHKRGTGDSGGDWASATFDDFIADTGAAIETLRADPRIDPHRIGVMGFSQGGRLAPVVAVRYRAEAVVSISGPQLSVAETRLWSLRNAMRRGGLAEADIEHALALWREFMDQLIDNSPTGDPGARAPDSPALDARITEAAARLPAQALPPRSAQYEPSPIFNSLAFDPADDLARLDVPWLVMYGEHDEVVPVAASVEALRAAFAASGYTGHELVVIPGSAHGLNDTSGERHELYETLPAAWLTETLEARPTHPGEPGNPALITCRRSRKPATSAPSPSTGTTRPRRRRP